MVTNITRQHRRRRARGFFAGCLVEGGMNTQGAEGGSAAAEESALDLADIQGFVLRAYRMPMVRHFLLTVGDPAHARRQLGRLVSGDESDAPQITTAADWHVGFAPGPGDDPADAPRRTPDYCLNIGITWPGLVALEVEERVPALSFESFGAFTDGAARRAESVGDTGAGSPANWIGGFGRGDDHVLVTLHAISPEAMTSYSDRLCAWFAEGDAFREIWRQDGMALMEMHDGQPVPTAKVHFGYTDGISYAHHSRRPGAVSRPITRSPASHGSSSCGTTPRTTSYPSRERWASTGASRSSRRSRPTSSASRTSCSRTRTRSIPSCWPQRSAGDGATAFLSPCHRTRTALREGSRPNS